MIYCLETVGEQLPPEGQRNPEEDACIWTQLVHLNHVGNTYILKHQRYDPPQIPFISTYL